MASRFSGKTYGRKAKIDKSSSAFDEAVKDVKLGVSKTLSTQQKWGKTSFTSSRAGEGGEPEGRKRHAVDDEPSLFEDPFGFDSDDEGPSKPKRGMGFKVDEEGAKATNKECKKSYGSKRQKKDENNDERDTMKRAPTKTYSRGSRLSNDASCGKSKQLSIDAFTTKLSSHSDNIANSSRQCKPKANKFFTSKNSKIEEDNTFMFSDGTEAHNSDNEGKECKNAGESDFEYNSDELANLESGDPEIVFNSPQKRRREAEKLKDTDSKSDHSKVKKSAGKPGKSSATSRLFADSDESDTDDLQSSQFSSQGSQHRSYGMKSNHGLKTQSKSMDTALTPSKFFPEFERADRAGSVDSTASSNNSGDVLKPKKALSLSSKLFSLEVERKQKKLSEAPVVRRLLTSPKKAKASYNPRQWHEDHEEGPSNSQSSQPGKSSAFDAEFDDAAPPPPLRMRGDPKVRRVMTEGVTQWDDDVTKVSVKREHKPYFQVVRHVKQAHECQESGENQEFNDELNYIMEGLDPSQSVAVRSLSCLSLAQKCTASSFRMHVRAHGVLDKAFHQLHDAHQYPVLALCTAAVMFLVSRDRFTMDLEKGTLELMLRVLSVQDPDQSPQKQNQEYLRMQGKMRAICDSVKIKGRATLDIEQVTTGQLAMESLLTFTSKKSGDWFKEDMRVLGGLDHIVNTVSECAEDVDSLLIDPSDGALDQIRKIERCLRVLENVTYMNSENQQHLISHDSGVLIKSLLRVLKSCENCLSLNRVEETAGKINKDSCGYIAFNCLLASLRVLLNITHDNEYGSTRVGMLEGLVNTVLLILLRVPQYVPADQRFDLLVLSLGLLINMVEHCEHNRSVLLTAHAVCPFDEFSSISRQPVTMDTLEALTKLFLIRYEAAKRIEVEHDEEMEKREKALAQHKQKRLAALHSGMGVCNDDPNASGVWKESAAGLEWIVNEDYDQEQQIAKMADNGHSQLDVNVELMPASQDEEENFTKALHKAGRHMEDCILAAYVALLIGCTIQGNTEHVDRVRDVLPEGDFDPMCRMLRKFLGFMNFTATEAVSQSSGSKSISRIIEVLDAC